MLNKGGWVTDRVCMTFLQEKTPKNRGGMGVSKNTPKMTKKIPFRV